MISEAPEGTAELHTLRYQMGGTKRRRLSSRRRTVVLNLFQKGLVFGILDASEIGMDLHHYIILYHVTAHRHIRNYIYIYNIIQIYTDYVYNIMFGSDHPTVPWHFEIT